MAKKVILKDKNDIELMPITRGELVLDSSGVIALHSNDFLATDSLPGLMSVEDKEQVNRLYDGVVTDDKVSQITTTKDNDYRILFSVTADDLSRIEGSYKSSKLLFNPHTGVLSSTIFLGNLDGNALTASKLYSGSNINGTLFTGEENIVTTLWGANRNISITDGINTSTAVSVNGSANVSLNLPETIQASFVGNLSGTASIANKLGTSDLGSSIKPIYLDEGVPKECNQYAGGTSVTLNGSSKAATTASFYAPTSAGVLNYVLVSGGSGKTPNWANIDDLVNGVDITEATSGTYELVGHSGDTLYSKTGVYFNAGTACLFAAHFYETSDIKFKTDVKSITSMENLPVLREFTWKDSGTKSYGFIALELEEQGYSELVNTNEKGTKTVNYSAALSLIVGKLQLKIEKLEKEIEKLKNN